MRISVVSIALGLGLLAGPLNASPFFLFSGEGWEGLPPLRGSFSARDTNDDGVITTNEVFGFSAVLGGRSFNSQALIEGPQVPPLPGGGSPFLTDFGLFYDLDGAIGNGSDFGEFLSFGSQGLAVFNLFGPEGEGAGIRLAWAGGYGPIVPATGTFEDLGVLTIDLLSLTRTPITVTSINFVMPDELLDDGAFVFELEEEEITPNQTIFIDPEIAVGYDYIVENSLFSSVTAPLLGWVADGDGEYTLSFNDTETTLSSGETFEFETPVQEFRITGIDRALMIDPSDPLGFVTGIALASTGPGIVVKQTPIVAPVPLPGTAPLLAGALALLVLRNRRSLGL